MYSFKLIHSCDSIAPILHDCVVRPIEANAAILEDVGKIRQSLQWRYNEHDGVSDHQPHDCLLNRLFRQENTKDLRHWPWCGEFTGDR